MFKIIGQMKSSRRRDSLYWESYHTPDNKRHTKSRKSSATNTSFNLNLILFPIHVNGDHWIAGGINFGNRKLYYLDSLGGLDSDFVKVIRNLIRISMGF